MQQSQVKVLIVDDSAIVRKTMTDILQSDPGIEVMGYAHDPIFAMQKMEKSKPDVILLDIEMPRMDGLTFLKKIMSEDPIPVVICSTLTAKGAETTIQALEYGAADIICKPKMGVKEFINDSKITIIDAVKAACKVNIKKLGRVKMSASAKTQAKTPLIVKPRASMSETTEKIIAIGASTGGTEALRYVLDAMPANSPGILIVQHMPEIFTEAFAQRMNKTSKLMVREAKHGDRLVPGLALIAPGSHHMTLTRSGAYYRVETLEGPLVSRHRPSVDVLFRSVARFAGNNAVGCIMTGMGKDGALGLKEMRDAGAKTVGQDESSSVVYGMPREAHKLGAVETQAALDSIPATLINMVNRITH
ncbi:MAG: chemotaxis response regulator protein-glutamate methylesterase [Oleispira sp.]|nr:chemotaxis response regulator protein-glutamate methylesterase [Oleispira sp.]